MKFKYSKLYTWLKEQISAGVYREGDRIPTEMALAKQFSLSRDTVRRAIGQLESEGMLYRIKGNGTFIKVDVKAETPTASVNLRKTDSKLIGVLMTEIDNYIFLDILAGLNDVFSQHGYRTALFFTNNKISEERKALLDMLEGDYAGYIIEPTKAALPQLNDDLYKKIAETTPALLIHAKLPGINLPTLTMGDKEGAFRLTTHLLEQGHRKIMIIVKVDDQTGTMRYLGYARAFQDFGLSIPDENIFWYNSDNQDALFPDFIDKKMREAFKDNTAIICQDDRVAHMLKKYLDSQDMDRVLCGFDGTALSAEDNVSTVVHPKRKFGEEAARRLLEKIKDPSKDVSYDFVPEIIYRNI